MDPTSFEAPVTLDDGIPISQTQSSVATGPTSSPHNFADESFKFCANQISNPVVIEVFCGSARLTSCMKSLGMTASFGVDHKLDKVVATAKQLDLTLPGHQQTLFMWLRSPLVVGVFLAPPCGTASLARNIQLRDSRGRAIAGPRPLRSAASPEGLPNLTSAERARVPAANILYELVAKVVT